MTAHSPTEGASPERVKELLFALDGRVAYLRNFGFPETPQSELRSSIELANCLRELERLRSSGGARERAIARGWADELLKLSDGSNYGSLEELQEALIALASDLDTGAQDLSDFAEPGAEL